jgi:thiamine-phosphate pyrophosphorylase
MKKTLLSGIYAITPDSLQKEELYKRVHKLLQKGIRIIQYRDKLRSAEDKLIIAKQLKTICQSFNSLLIINDDIHIAKKINAHGVHLGQKDIACNEARNILGSDPIIGISCQNNLELALKAQHEGADYVAFGSIFKTTTKKDVVHCSLEDLKDFVEKIEISSVAIGGINLSNFKEVKKSGIDMIAMSSELFLQKEIPELEFFIEMDN